jgi:hypothetical protein
VKATIWAGRIRLPAGFCYNCNAPATTTINIHSEGGIAGSGLLGAFGPAGLPHEVTYCQRCVVNATKEAPNRAAPTLGILLMALGFGVVAYFTDGADRVVALAVALAALGGLVAWLRYIRRPRAPGQTTRWRAFAVLNEGKDLLEGNREFLRIEYSNPRVLEEILRLNPGIEVTST